MYSILLLKLVRKGSNNNLFFFWCFDRGNNSNILSDLSLTSRSFFRALDFDLFYLCNIIKKGHSYFLFICYSQSFIIWLHNFNHCIQIPLLKVTSDLFFFFFNKPNCLYSLYPSCFSSACDNMDHPSSWLYSFFNII